MQRIVLQIGHHLRTLNYSLQQVSTSFYHANLTIFSIAKKMRKLNVYYQSSLCKKLIQTQSSHQRYSSYLSTQKNLTRNLVIRSKGILQVLKKVMTSMTMKTIRASISS
jgi:hypothetical protein